MRGLVEFVDVGSSSLIQRVRDLLGWGSAAANATISQHLEDAAISVRSFTRGNGWIKTDNGWRVSEDLAGVIVSVAVRSMVNPEQVRRIEAGEFNALPSDPGSWSLREWQTLTDYRDMAG